MYTRDKTRTVHVGPVQIGGQNKVVIQSMTNTETTNIQATVKQINELYSAGCELVRIACPDQQSIHALGAIVSQSPIPVIADIHFDYRLAIGAIEAGAAKVRINPGNIGNQKHVKLILDTAKKYHISIRIGVNTGSVRTQENRVKQAQKLMKEYMEFVKENRFDQIVVSMKSSHVTDLITLNEWFARHYDSPLHIGVTEAGALQAGIVKSAVGIGSLLERGLGDTIRVSLSGSPLQEIPIARDILRTLDLLKEGIDVVACPTCGRTTLDIEEMVRQVNDRLSHVTQPLVIAVMGCEVNGPGEAAMADYGICGSRKQGIVFRRGQVVSKVATDQLIDELVRVVGESEKIPGLLQNA